MQVYPPGTAAIPALPGFNPFTGPTSRPRETAKPAPPRALIRPGGLRADVEDNHSRHPSQGRPGHSAGICRTHPGGQPEQLPETGRLHGDTPPPGGQPDHDAGRRVARPTPEAGAVAPARHCARVRHKIMWWFSPTVTHYTGRPERGATPICRIPFSRGELGEFNDA